MTVVLVTGATGILGPEVVPRLLAAGYSVRAFSRQSRPALPEAVEVFRGDLKTEDGLAAATAGAEVVIHAASAPFGKQRTVNVEGTRAVVEHGIRNGVRHLVYPSIVGCDRIPLRYYKTKAAGEQVIEHSPIPWTIVRATQFHELIRRALARTRRLPVKPIPRGLRFQVLDAGEAATRIVELVTAGPSGRVEDIGGPAVRRIEDLAAAYYARAGVGGRTVLVPAPGDVAAGFRAGLNTTTADRYGTITWEQFLDERGA